MLAIKDGTVKPRSLSLLSSPSGFTQLLVLEASARKALRASEAAFKKALSPSLGTTYQILGQNDPLKQPETVAGRGFAPIPENATIEENCKKDNLRDERYALQNQASLILRSHVHPNGKHWRCCSCLRGVRNEGGVDLLKSNKDGRVKFHGLTICASVWTCALCAVRVTDYRKMEIEEAMLVHTAAGGACYMLTYTFPHKKHDDVSELVLKFRAAFVKMREKRAYKEALKDVKYIGLVRALEVTFGFANGFHPHSHECLFLEAELSSAEVTILSESIFPLWRSACVAAGLTPPSRERGLSITRSFSPQEYLVKFGYDSKWGTGAELTKSHVKKGHGDNRMTPFDFLRASLAGDYRYERLFRQYATAFFRARQCYWTNGLKAKFGIKDLSDEEICELVTESHTHIGKIDMVRWHKVIYSRSDVRTQVLKIAEQYGFDAVVDFIDETLADLDPEYSRVTYEIDARIAIDEAKVPRPVTSKPPAKKTVRKSRTKDIMPTEPLLRSF